MTTFLNRTSRRKYKSETDYHLVEEAYRIAGKSIYAVKVILETHGIEMPIINPPGYWAATQWQGQKPSEEANALDKDMCKAWGV